MVAMAKSVWLYVNPSRDWVKVFESSDSALEWFQRNDPDGVAVQWPVEEQQTLAAKPTRTDYQILVDAFLKARAILTDYVEDGRAYRAVDQLMSALINDQVFLAISRIEGRKRFGVIEGIPVRNDAS